MQGDDEKAVVSAMLLGYRNNISSDLYDSYTDTGVVHVLAVSGLHVGIVAGLLLYLLSFLTDKRLSTKILKTVIVIAILSAYVLITGAAPAVLRAAIMFGLMLIASFLSNDLNVFNSLSLAAIAMLLVDTSMLFQASFQFSFLALTSIVFFQPYLVQLVSPKNKALDWMWQMVTVALSAQILVFPLTIFYFHKFPLYFMLSSIIAIPAAVGIIYGGILLIGAALILPAAASSVIGVLLSYWVWGFNKAIALINALPGTVVDGIWFERSTTILLYVLIGLLMILLAFNRKPQTIFAGLYVVLLMVVLSGFRSITRHHQAHMTIYDIYGGYAIDFIIDDKTYYLRDSTISPEKYHFAVFNNRIKHRANTPVELQSTLQGDQIFADVEKGYIEACDKRIVITGGSVPVVCTSVDMLIVTKSDKLHPYTYLSTIDPTLIVIDSSLDWQQRKAWNRAAELYGSTLYAINRQGALTYNLHS
jgi:competence protein ComEC